MPRNIDQQLSFLESFNVNVEQRLDLLDFLYYRHFSRALLDRCGIKPLTP